MFFNEISPEPVTIISSPPTAPAITSSKLSGVAVYVSPVTGVGVDGIGAVIVNPRSHFL